MCSNFYEGKLEKALLVSGDGDYHCIVHFLKNHATNISIISPNQKYLSYLLRKSGVPLIILDDFKNKLKKKPPDTP